jgi:hypothetical protein
MTILTKERVDELVKWLYDKHAMSDRDSVIPQRYMDVIGALTELSELRTKIANKWQSDYDGDVTCFYCGKLQDWDDVEDEERTDVHVSDCPVLRYADYKQEE